MSWEDDLPQPLEDVRAGDVIAALLAGIAPLPDEPDEEQP